MWKPPNKLTEKQFDLLKKAVDLKSEEIILNENALEAKNKYNKSVENSKKSVKDFLKSIEGEKGKDIGFYVLSGEGATYILIQVFKDYITIAAGLRATYTWAPPEEEKENG